MSFYTKGNKILNEKGEQVILKGVSRTGLEYSYVDLDAMIPEIIDFDIQLMKKWGFNSIRFPLRDIFWLNDTKYKQKIQYWVNQTLSNNMYAILDLHTQEDHPGLDPFMFRSGGAMTMWIDIAQTYKDIPHIFFEIFNEPHGISSNVWWNGDEDYYGYKEILVAIRRYANNICLIGGLDYAYQFNFVQRNTTLLEQMKSIPNLALSVHPYGYKGIPMNEGEETMQIPTTITENPLNHTGDCHLGVSVPSVPPSQYGWDESFGVFVKQDIFPVIATEWGLDKPDNCIQGGWYNVQILDYLNSLNISYMAWAWVQDRLDYPSLLDIDFLPTGKGSRPTIGPACSGLLNNFYQGPGVLVMNDLKTFPKRILMEQAHPPKIENLFVRNFFLLLLILIFFFNFVFFVFNIPERKTEREPEIHRVISTTKLQNSIRIRSSHSLLQLK
jgi:hypothetical protein